MDEWQLRFSVLVVLATGLVAPVAAQQSDTISNTQSADRVILITGSTGGLGREVARRLASPGTHVIVHGRNRERGMDLVSEIESGGRGSASFYAADLANLNEVRQFGESILRDFGRLDILINNAGIFFPRSTERRLSDDGYELHFAVNYLSHFLLTRMLLPLLESSRPARIINVASVAQTPIDFDDVMLENDYGGSRAYAQSKLAQVMFTMDLANELEGSGVVALALHPATLMDTDMVLEAGIRPRATVDEGADAVMQLVTMDDPPNGQYFDGMEPARANDQAYDADARARLRALSEGLTAR